MILRMTEEQGKQETRAFQAEIQQLLQLLVHSLYVHKDVFLRELISNAADALSRRRFESLTEHSREGAEGAEDDDNYAIWVEGDSDGKVIRVKDSGIGMTRQELVDNLGTIARSGTVEFLKTAAGKQISDLDFIGQFGVGFYSSFMVAEKIEIHTKSAKEEVAVDESPALCGHCGEIKGGEKCCVADAEKCGGCKLAKGSPGCCTIEPGKDVALCSHCGQIAGSDKCCDINAKKCGSCGLAKGSPGCCTI